MNYEFEGFIIPISNSFFTNKKLNAKIAFAIKRNFAWSFIHKVTEKNKIKKKNSASKDGNVCEADHILFGKQDQIHEFCCIKNKTLKYNRCNLCKQGNAHFCSPLDHLTGGRIARKAKDGHVTLIKAFLQLTTEHFQHPNENKMLNSYLTHFYIQSLSLISTIQGASGEEKQKLITKIIRRGAQDLDSSLKEYFNINATKYPDIDDGPMFYFPSRDNIECSTSEDQWIRKISERKAYVLNNDNVCTTNTHPAENNEYWVAEENKGAIYFDLATNKISIQQVWIIYL